MRVVPNALVTFTELRDIAIFEGSDTSPTYVCDARPWRVVESARDDLEFALDDNLVRVDYDGQYAWFAATFPVWHGPMTTHILALNPEN